jgi:hypothetical protein
MYTGKLQTRVFYYRRLLMLFGRQAPVRISVSNSTTWVLDAVQGSMIVIAVMLLLSVSIVHVPWQRQQPMFL